MKAYVFPGQGSQSKGMGIELFDEFKELTDKADQILGYSIKQLCLEDPNNQLGSTLYTQPALYTVEALSYLHIIKSTGKKPDYVAGHSLGEYVALFAAGAFDFETGLKLVKKRGELMSTAANGAMAAVVGLNEQRVEEILRLNHLDAIDVANYNSTKQVVISGLTQDINNAKAFFEAEGARYILLKTSGAFHSRYMLQAAQLFEKYISDIEFSPLTIPVISNAYARPYQQNTIKQTLVKQISNPVKWTESIRYLMGKGVDDIEEIGPRNVLTKLVSDIKSNAQPLIISEPEKETSINCHKAQLMATSLGSDSFKSDYGLKYAYIAGSMYKGISSKELVVAMGKAGMVGFFGTGGVRRPQIEEAIHYIKQNLTNGEPYGFNLIHSPSYMYLEEEAVDTLIEHDIRLVEASAFMDVTPSLVRYRLNGLKRNADGSIKEKNKIIAKLSRPEVAKILLSPPPANLLKRLLSQGLITEEEATLGAKLPVVTDITAEADSGGHTDQRVMSTLLPTMIRLRDEMMAQYHYERKIRVGAAGGIGTPEAAAAAFLLGADFIVTGSINECTVEAATSDLAKDLLQQADIQDTAYAPAGDMFELGSKIQVLKKGVFFPTRANKLYELYKLYESIDALEPKTITYLEEKYFKRSIAEIYEDVKNHYDQSEIERAEANPKHKMALIFKWYFSFSTRAALEGDAANQVQFQIPCGSSLGAFNHWVKDTPIENWRNRHVAEIGVKLMTETATYINNYINKLL